MHTMPPPQSQTSKAKKSSEAKGDVNTDAKAKAKGKKKQTSPLHQKLYTASIVDGKRKYKEYKGPVMRMQRGDGPFNIPASNLPQTKGSRKYTYNTDPITGMYLIPSL